MSDTAWIELAALVLTCGVTIVTCVIYIRKGTEDVKTSVFKKIDAIEKDRNEAELAMERRMGEVGNALREKIGSVEFHVRDNYVHKDSFKQLVDLILSNHDKQFELVRQDVKALSEKFDTLQNLIHNSK